MCQESSNIKLTLYGVTNECIRTNTILLLLSEVITGAVSLTILILHNSSAENEKDSLISPCSLLLEVNGDFWGSLAPRDCCKPRVN